MITQELSLESIQFKLATMRAEGIAVPRKATAQAKHYIRCKIRQARKRGAKRIDPAAARFAR